MKKNNKVKHFLLLCGFLVEGFNQQLHAIKPSILFSKFHLQQQIRALKVHHETLVHNYNHFKTLSSDERKVVLKVISAFSCMHLGERPILSFKDGFVALLKGTNDFCKNSSYKNSDKITK